MTDVLVVLEVADGKLRSQSLPGIAAGREIAQARGGSLHLLVLAADPSTAAAAIAADGYGAVTVHASANPTLEPFTAEAWGDAIVAASLSGVSRGILAWRPGLSRRHG